jgi:hypothetical protein
MITWLARRLYLAAFHVMKEEGIEALTFKKIPEDFRLWESIVRKILLDILYYSIGEGLHKGKEENEKEKISSTEIQPSN